MTASKNKVKNLAFSAVCLALCLVLPFLTGQIPEIGNMLCPMHIPVLLCGFIAGWPWGLGVGFVAPLLRYVIFGMPVIYPMGISMAFELAAYGFLTGFLYRRLPKTIPNLYMSLLGAMVGGRLVWGAARFLMAGLSGSQFPMSAFLAGAVTTAVPGIVVQVVLIPAIVAALKKANLMNE